MNGRGKYEYANPKGASYDGLWINGRKEDDSATYICTQYKYTGSYKNDKQNGKAQIIFLTGNRAGDTFSGEIVNNKFAKGTYTYSEKNTQRKKYEGEFTNNNNKFNGQGTLTYRGNSEDKGLWKDDVFLDAQIGVYQNQPVLKRGDTIITHNNRYLLSQQSIADKDGSFIINKDIKGKVEAIGYVTHSGNISDLQLYSSIAKIAANAKDCKFYQKDREQIGICNDIPVYKDGDIIIIAAAKYDLKEQERGNLVDESKKDYIIATLQGGQFNLKNIIGVVKVTGDKYSFVQINTRYLGTYNRKEVVYFDNIRIVAVGNLESTYCIDWQIYQKNEDINNKSFVRYYLIYNGRTKPDTNFYSNKGEYVPIAWIDFYSDTDVKFGTKSTTENIGLNYFASYYVGDKNPKFNNKDNYDLKPQDIIDAAAREHDICYGKNNISGVSGVFHPTKGLDCDQILISICEKIKNNANIIESMRPTIYDYMPTNERAALVYSFFSTTSKVKQLEPNIPAVIDFAAEAGKIGLGFAATATSLAGATSLAVPVLSVAAVNLLQTEAKCLYSFLKDNAPAHCYSTKGIITHAWDVNAAKEMATGVLSTGMGKGISENMKMLNVNTAIKVGKTTYDGGQVATQTLATLSSLKQEQNNK
jgi:hypothetical protein